MFIAMATCEMDCVESCLLVLISALKSATLFPVFPDFLCVANYNKFDFMRQSNAVLTLIGASKRAKS